MRIALAPLLAAAAFGLGPAVYAAPQPPPPPAAQPATPAGPGAMAGRMGGATPGTMMPGGMMMDMGAMHCMGMTDAKLAAAKADLAITDKQQRSWDTFVERMRTSAMGPGMMMGGGMMTGPLPERLRQHEKMMSDQIGALRRNRAAVSRLYGALTPEQRAKADRYLCDQMGGRMAGAMDSPMAGRGAGAGATPAAPGAVSPDHVH